MRRLILLILLTSPVLLVAPAADGVASNAWQWPVDGHRVVNGFDPPTSSWGAGHRGIDLEAAPGSTVRAVAAGRVTFVGKIGGTWSVAITHGAERSTYQPVLPSVDVGQAVEAGEPIGRLLGGHASCAGACLHLGRRRGSEYLDPLELLPGSAAYVLVSPNGPVPKPPVAAGSGIVDLLAGPVTSPFGMRRHPVTGVYKLHDGTDIGAACGTRVPAAAAGTVVRAGRRGAYGNQVEVRHNRHWSTSYSHLSRIDASVGQHVAPGDIIGLVGRTGLVTGCHLHFMSIIDGTPVDPLTHVDGQD